MVVVIVQTSIEDCGGLLILVALAKYRRRIVVRNPKPKTLNDAIYLTFLRRS